MAKSPTKVTRLGDQHPQPGPKLKPLEPDTERNSDGARVQLSDEQQAALYFQRKRRRLA
jgi:hypothetical protein